MRFLRAFRGLQPEGSHSTGKEIFLWSSDCWYPPKKTKARMYRCSVTRFRLTLTEIFRYFLFRFDSWKKNGKKSYRSDPKKIGTPFFSSFLVPISFFLSLSLSLSLLFLFVSSFLFSLWIGLDWTAGDVQRQQVGGQDVGTGRLWGDPANSMDRYKFVIIIMKGSRVGRGGGTRPQVIPRRRMMTRSFVGRESEFRWEDDAPAVAERQWNQSESLGFPSDFEREQIESPNIHLESNMEQLNNNSVKKLIKSLHFLPDLVWKNEKC